MNINNYYFPDISVENIVLVKLGDHEGRSIYKIKLINFSFCFKCIDKKKLDLIIKEELNAVKKIINFISETSLQLYSLQTSNIMSAVTS